ncbi:hypothetical protein BJ138DRAFT_1119506 [Hygrophoropsis aurantiaca]|uniref:Uncharacterized protein n=1 Tax=Hygrophoropsis aurantiaca TaxID=72124 RepID=A0ACB7ZT18_9AGAM|nr:hypothetical protein BJ138DRAFT_1119506 [Hygrophoropsis aurantiaca]
MTHASVKRPADAPSDLLAPQAHPERLTRASDAFPNSPMHHLARSHLKRPAHVSPSVTTTPAPLPTPKPQQRQSRPTSLAAARSNPQSASTNTPAEACTVADAPALQVGTLRHLWRRCQILPQWTRRKPDKNRDEPRESQPVVPSPALVYPAPCDPRRLRLNAPSSHLTHEPIDDNDEFEVDLE